MLVGFINLALLAGAVLCVMLLVCGCYQVLKFLFWEQGFSRVVAWLVDRRPEDLDKYVPYAE